MSLKNYQSPISAEEERSAFCGMPQMIKTTNKMLKNMQQGRKIGKKS